MVPHARSLHRRRGTITSARTGFLVASPSNYGPMQPGSHAEVCHTYRHLNTLSRVQPATYLRCYASAVEYSVRSDFADERSEVVETSRGTCTLFGRTRRFGNASI